MAGSLSNRTPRLPGAQRISLQGAALSNAEKLSLRDLRKSLHLTQIDVARRLNKGQDVVSRIEQRGDLLFSTLGAYVHSLGGELELVCRFKNRPAVRIAIAGNGNGARTGGRRPSLPRVPISIAKLRQPIALLCKRHGVRELSLFGSILRDDFDLVSSDVDAAVSFGPPRGESLAHQYFDFKQGLERLFGRPVDLVELDAMADTRLKRIIESTKMNIYAAEG